MPTYQLRGEVPRKRHVQFRDNGTLLTEEVMGLEGFSGNESILYHLTSPCRIKELGPFEPIVREEWVPDAHAHRHFTTGGLEPEGDALSGRQLLMWNDDVEISFCRPTDEMEGFYRNGEGDEVVFVHEGSGTLETIFGDLPYRRATTSSSRAARPTASPPTGRSGTSSSSRPGLIEIPRRYRNEYGQLLEHAPYYHRDIHPPTELQHAPRAGRVRRQGARPRRLPDVRPRLPPVRRRRAGTATSTRGRSTSTTSSRSPGASTCRRPRTRPSRGSNFVICSFCPRKLDFDPHAIPIPYHHSNLNSEEMLYYVDGNFSSRKGIEIGSVTLHPSGIPHGPQPGPRREVDRDDRDARAGRDVRHVPPAAADGAGEELDDGSTPTRGTTTRARRRTADEDPAGVTSHLLAGVSRQAGSAAAGSEAETDTLVTTKWVPLLRGGQVQRDALGLATKIAPLNSVQPCPFGPRNGRPGGHAVKFTAWSPSTGATGSLAVVRSYPSDTVARWAAGTDTRATQPVLTMASSFNGR